MSNFSVLFVCMGNICRSPTAHGVFKRKLMDAGIAHLVKVDSAGTHNYHPGSPPDARSQVHAERRGYDLSDLRARQITEDDFEQYDLILVMDWDNLALVQDECPTRHQAKVRRLTEFCLTHDAAVVPDPYHGGAGGSIRCWTWWRMPVMACCAMSGKRSRRHEGVPTGSCSG